MPTLMHWAFYSHLKETKIVLISKGKVVAEATLSYKPL
jgi:hypothetical protein